MLVEDQVFESAEAARAAYLTRPVIKPKGRPRRFRGPLEGCPNPERHAWDRCKDCRRAYMRLYRQA